MDESETTNIHSRLTTAERGLEHTRSMFAAFAAVAVGGILITALFTPFLAVAPQGGTVASDESNMMTGETADASLGETIGALMDKSGDDDFGLAGSLALTATMSVYAIVIAGLLALVFIALRGVSRAGAVAARVVGAALFAAVITLWITLAAPLQDAEHGAGGPAVWLLLLGAVLYGILVFTRNSAELWGQDRS